MVNKKNNSIKSEALKNGCDEGYFISITNNDTGLIKEMYLSDLEFKILNLAVQHNRGMINLLSNVKTIHGLFQKGLVTITKDNLAVPCVSDVVAFMLKDDTLDDFSENENKPNGTCKQFGNLNVCLCCL